MSMKRISLIFALITALAVFVSGCKPPPTFDMAKAEVAKTSNTIHQKEAEDIPPPAPVVTMSGPYVDTQRVSLQKPPGWLKQRVVAHGNKLPFVFYVDQLLGETGTHIRYDKTIDKKLPVSLDYSGSIQGALEELATVTDYNFEIDNKKDMLTWSALVSKMFSIKFLPGTTNYELGQTLELESDEADAEANEERLEALEALIRDDFRSNRFRLKERSLTPPSSPNDCSLKDFAPFALPLASMAIFGSVNVDPLLAKTAPLFPAGPLVARNRWYASGRLSAWASPVRRRKMKFDATICFTLRS